MNGQPDHRSRRTYLFTLGIYDSWAIQKKVKPKTITRAKIQISVFTKKNCRRLYTVSFIYLWFIHLVGRMIDGLTLAYRNNAFVLINEITPTLSPFNRLIG